MIHEIKYNSQRDNDPFGGQRLANAQCFPTCAWMFLAHFIREIDATDDKGLAQFFNEIEEKIVGGSIIEQFRREFPNSNIPQGVYTSVYWDVECYGVNKYFERYGVNKKAVWEEVNFGNLRDILFGSPVVFGTNLTAAGHIILLKGYDDNGFYANDPWGDAKTDYKNTDGDTWYDNELVRSTGEQKTKRKNIMRVLYAHKGKGKV